MKIKFFDSQGGQSLHSHHLPILVLGGVLILLTILFSISIFTILKSSNPVPSDRNPSNTTVVHELSDSQSLRHNISARNNTALKDIIVDDNNEPFNYFSWYSQTITKQQAPPGLPSFTLPDVSTFGVYTSTLVDNTLFLGFSPGVPGQNGAEGALVASIDVNSNRNKAIIPIFPMLTEEGVLNMVPSQRILHIGGVDPMDDWSMGNMYTIDLNARPYSINKFRETAGLTGVVHVFGLSEELIGFTPNNQPSSRMIIGATANLTPIPGIPTTYPTPPYTYAQIYERLPDQTNRWRQKYTFPYGEAMVYDLENLNAGGKEYIFAKVALESGGKLLVASTDGGTNWSTVSDTINFNDRVEPALFLSRLVIPNTSSNDVIDRLSIVSPNSNGTYTISDVYTSAVMDVYRPVPVHKNWVVVPNPSTHQEWLYVLAKNTQTQDYAVLRTSDSSLSTWEHVVSLPTGDYPIMINTVDKGKLLVTTRGSHARILTIDLVGVNPIPIPTATMIPTNTPPPAIVPVVCHQCDLSEDGVVTTDPGSPDASVMYGCMGAFLTPSVTPTPPYSASCIRSDFGYPRYRINAGDYSQFFSNCSVFNTVTCQNIQCTKTADVNHDGSVNDADILALKNSNCFHANVWSSDWFSCRTYDVLGDDVINDQDIGAIQACM